MDNNTIDKKKIDIPLPNGYHLVAVQGGDPNFPYEICVGIEDSEGIWYQDLAMIHNAYHYGAESFDPIWDEGKFEVLVWGKEYDEDYTESFQIDLYQQEEQNE